MPRQEELEWLGDMPGGIMAYGFALSVYFTSNYKLRPDFFLSLFGNEIYSDISSSVMVIRF